MKARTAICGEVEIREVFSREEDARAAGYRYDAHAYRLNAFGGTEPVSWKVLGRSTDFIHMDFAIAGGEKDVPSDAAGGDPADVREERGVDRMPREGLPAICGPVQV